MSGLLQKVVDFIGFGSEEEMEEEVMTSKTVPHKQEEERTTKRAKVVAMHAISQLNVVVSMPESFEDARDIADHLKQKRPCIVNLEAVENVVSRRIVDFLGGAVYAVDGNMQRVSSGIFLLTPYDVNIMGDYKDELLNNKGY